jgi:hypothetical protein
MPVVACAVGKRAGSRLFDPQQRAAGGQTSVVLSPSVPLRRPRQAIEDVAIERDEVTALDINDHR